jgi:hypothetical protein
MQHFSVDILAWAVPAAGMSFLWPSTFSFVTPPLVALAPVVVMLLLISCAFSLGFHCYRMYPLVQITPLTLGFWSVAFCYPVLEFMVLYGPSVKLGLFGYGGYPGFYLHSFAPALAPVIGIAITTVARNGLARTVFWLLLGYNIVFLFAATLMQFLYFAGCGSNGFSRFNVGSASACWLDWRRLTDNLDALAYPWAALWLAAGGAIVLGLCALTSLALASSRTNRSKLDAAHRCGEGPLAETGY